MKKFFVITACLALMLGLIPTKASAAGGVFPSGGGTKTVGQSFTVTVTASGATFNAFQGTISVSGPVSVTSFNAGSADTWMSKPSNGGTFAGAILGRTATSLTIATITLKGNSPGSGAVTVSGVVLKNSADTVGTGGGTANFTIQKAPDLPGAVVVTSASHPDQNQAYEATTVALAWDKATGVDGFSYLIDQVADTTPTAKVVDANVSVSYPDKAVGTYYFHIRAHKPDGWGGSTHFKINIKEPDPKINQSLFKPADINIKKSDQFINNLDDGTVTGTIISGKTEPNFIANITLTPTPKLPEGKKLAVQSDKDGYFSLLIDYPISSGFYKLTVQGQKEKVLTPISDPIIFEIYHQKGGGITVLSASDKYPPKPIAERAKEKTLFGLNLYSLITIGGVLILLLVLGVVLYLKRRHRQKAGF